MAMNLAQFELFSSAKQRQIERTQGPQQLSTDRMDTFEEDTEEDLAGIAEITRILQ